MGCMHASLARIRGAGKVLLADVREERLKLASPFGVDVLIDASREDVRARVLEETAGNGASVVIVAAPSGPAQEQALTMAAKHGRISFFGGLPKTNPTISVNANLIHYRELFVMGAYGSMPRHNRSALELLAGGQIQSGSLIGLVVPLDRIADGFDAVAQGKVLKALVRPSA
jgi:L-iditol 2-dehydrogenase